MQIAGSTNKKAKTSESAESHTQWTVKTTPWSEDSRKVRSNVSDGITDEIRPDGLEVV